MSRSRGLAKARIPSMPPREKMMRKARFSFLCLVKELTGRGSYRYALSERRVSAGSETRLRNIFKEGVVSVDVAQNIVVVRTMPGLASAACSALDGMDIPGMVGSLAGDDTGILIMRDNAAAQQFNGEVHKLLK